eukprot:CAMPEP_0176446866 /NCGR_PEP_ID=MMETSP0127-20121128/24612_2 /TAXON_ID=938130 /ORGANISM="Platyophrya macrostoma, Strain WH" /LENGTH=131 /DNA_ID=CAMNT_0017833045 /DNA_START=486 /DNA_END=881 /DNA_ORIENTATION=-
MEKAVESLFVPNTASHRLRAAMPPNSGRTTRVVSRVIKSETLIDGDTPVAMLAVTGTINGPKELPTAECSVARATSPPAALVDAMLNPIVVGRQERNDSAVLHDDGSCRTPSTTKGAVSIVISGSPNKDMP